mgnify:CR=1 FL=1
MANFSEINAADKIKIKKLVNNKVFTQREEGIRIRIADFLCMTVK